MESALRGVSTEYEILYSPTVSLSSLLLNVISRARRIGDYVDLYRGRALSERKIRFVTAVSLLPGW